MPREFENSSHQRPELCWDNLKELKFVRSYADQAHKIHKQPNVDHSIKRKKPKFNDERIIEMSKLQQMAYAFNFGHLFCSIDGSEWNPRRFLWSAEMPPGDPSPFWASKRFSVSFNHAEMTDKEILEDYFRPWLDKEGFDKTAHLSDYDKIERFKSYEYERSTMKWFVDQRVWRVIKSFLHKEDVKDEIMAHTFDFAKEIGMLMDEDAWKAEHAFHHNDQHCSTHLRNLGLETQPEILFGYETWLKICSPLGVTGVTALGERHMCPEPMRRSFEIMNEQLRDNEEEFLQATFEEKMKTFSYLDPSDLELAVYMYRVLTRVVTAAVGVGTTRVLLADSEDALMIELDENLVLEPACHTNESFPLVLKCRYRWFSRSDEYYLLFFCSFVLPTKGYAEKLEKFKQQSQVLSEKEVEAFLAKASHREMINEETVASRVKSSTRATSSRDFKLHEDAFEHMSYVKMIDAIQTFVVRGSDEEHPVMLVDPEIFLKMISEKYIFGNAIGRTSAILKLYDPAWLPFRYTSDTRSKFQEKCMNELRIYERLAPLMGSVVPRIYSYGKMGNVSVRIGQYFYHIPGKYILMQAFDKTDRPYKEILTPEFVEDKVIPAYRRLHELGVVHNNFSRDRLVITTEEEVKLVGFRNSYFSDFKSSFENEISMIYSELK